MEEALPITVGEPMASGRVHTAPGTCYHTGLPSSSARDHTSPREGSKSISRSLAPDCIAPGNRIELPDDKSSRCEQNPNSSPTQQVILHEKQIELIEMKIQKHCTIGWYAHGVRALPKLSFHRKSSVQSCRSRLNLPTSGLILLPPQNEGRESRHLCDFEPDQMRLRTVPMHKPQCYWWYQLQFLCTRPVQTLAKASGLSAIHGGTAISATTACNAPSAPLYLVAGYPWVILDGSLQDWEASLPLLWRQRTTGELWCSE